MRKGHRLLPLVTLLTAINVSHASAAQLPADANIASKQEIVRQLKDEPASLDPAKAVGLPEIPVIRDLFEGLTNQDKSGNIIAGVAESWHSSDNKTWLFKLRRDARWSNGDPVTSQDFVYSWQRLVDPKTSSPFAWFAALAGIKNAAAITAGKLPAGQLAVTAPDPLHLRVELDRPIPWFPAMVANFSLFPVPEKIIKQQGMAWTRPGNLVGNGAYQLSQRVVNEQVVLTRNHHYWNDSNTVLNKVTYVPIAEESIATKRYRAGDIDITESFPKNLYPLLKKQLPGQIYLPNQLGTNYFAFNTRSGPTADARVRQALSWSIDRDLIVNKVLGTGEKAAWHFTPAYTRGFTPKELPIQQHDQQERLAMAKTLLAAAGYDKQRPLHLKLLYNTSESNKLLAVAIASMWKKNLGVDVQLENQEWKTYIDSRNTGKFDVVRASWVSDFNEPSSFLSLLTSTHSGNIAGYHNPEYDKLLDKATRESSVEKRNQDYNQAETLLARDVPIMPIYHYTNSRLIKPWVKGYPLHNPEDVAYSRDLWIERH